MPITFDEPNNKVARIKVIGVGGCGGNIVNYMHSRKISGVHYAAINTDAQALASISGEVCCVQIGENVTNGLGSGANPETAAEAARQDGDRLREQVRGMDMVFVTAGMGKGTGTGAAPVVAQIAREEGALTVAVVTRPFIYERRDRQADKGLMELAKNVDSLVIVPNEKLREVLPANVKMKEALLAANDVLYNAVCGISEIVTKYGTFNVDFKDVRSVMSTQGKAVIGSARESGENRAEAAANAALRSPLMEDVDLSNATGVLVNITGREDEMEFNEMDKVQAVISEHIPENENSQFTGIVYDESMGEDLRVTIIVTGVSDSYASKAEPPPLSVMREQIKDDVFRSGQNIRKIEDMTKEHGGDSRNVPAVLRRQLS